MPYSAEFSTAHAIATVRFPYIALMHADDGVVGVRVDWGDGSPSSTRSVTPATTELVITHTYAARDSYGVSVYCTYAHPDNPSFTWEEVSDTFTATVVDLEGMTGSVLLSYLDLSIDGQTATLTADAALANDYAFSAYIHWGDDSQPEAFSPYTKTHTYAESGPHQVSVQYLDAYDMSIQFTVTVGTVTVRLAPEDVTVNADRATLSYTVGFTFSDLVVAPADTTIDWGDGQVDDYSNDALPITATHTYAPGTGGDITCNGVLVQTAPVTPAPSDVIVTGDTITGYTVTMSFPGLTTAPDGAVIGWGDGARDNISGRALPVSVTHAYPARRVDTTIVCGGYVLAAPTALPFTGSLAITRASSHEHVLVIAFAGLSVAPPGLQVRWGDGTIVPCTGALPQTLYHTYADPGNYHIGLTSTAYPWLTLVADTTGQLGCATDTEVFPGYFALAESITDYLWEAQTGEVLVTFGPVTDPMYAAYAPTGVTWGDGTSSRLLADLPHPLRVRHRYITAASDACTVTFLVGFTRSLPLPKPTLLTTYSGTPVVADLPVTKISTAIQSSDGDVSSAAITGDLLQKYNYCAERGLPFRIGVRAIGEPSDLRLYHQGSASHQTFLHALVPGTCYVHVSNVRANTPTTGTSTATVTPYVVFERGTLDTCTITWNGGTTQTVVPGTSYTRTYDPSLVPYPAFSLVATNSLGETKVWSYEGAINSQPGYLRPPDLPLGGGGSVYWLATGSGDAWEEIPAANFSYDLPFVIERVTHGDPEVTAYNLAFGNVLDVTNDQETLPIGQAMGLTAQITASVGTRAILTVYPAAPAQTVFFHFSGLVVDEFSTLRLYAFPDAIQVDGAPIDAYNAMGTVPTIPETPRVRLTDVAFTSPWDVSVSWQEVAPDAPITARIVQWGDGTTTTVTDARSASHVYTSTGTFTITVRISNAMNQQARAWVDVPILRVEPEVRLANVEHRADILSGNTLFDTTDCTGAVVSWDGLNLLGTTSQAALNGGAYGRGYGVYTYNYDSTRSITLTATYAPSLPPVDLEFYASYLPRRVVAEEVTREIGLAGYANLHDTHNFTVAANSGSNGIMGIAKADILDVNGYDVRVGITAVCVGWIGYLTHISWGEITTPPTAPTSVNNGDVLTHTYPSVPATYTITVTVTPPGSAHIPPFSESVTVRLPSTLDAYLAIDTVEELTVSLRPQVSGDGFSPSMAQAQLDWGDGTVVNVPGSAMGSADGVTWGDVYSHVYAAPGSYALQLHVSAPPLQSVTATRTLTVSDATHYFSLLPTPAASTGSCAVSRTLADDGIALALTPSALREYNWCAAHSLDFIIALRIRGGTRHVLLNQSNVAEEYEPRLFAGVATTPQYAPRYATVCSSTVINRVITSAGTLSSPTSIPGGGLWGELTDTSIALITFPTAWTLSRPVVSLNLVVRLVPALTGTFDNRATLDGITLDAVALPYTLAANGALLDVYTAAQAAVADASTECHLFLYPSAVGSASPWTLMPPNLGDGSGVTTIATLLRDSIGRERSSRYPPVLSWQSYIERACPASFTAQLCGAVPSTADVQSVNIFAWGCSSKFVTSAPLSNITQQLMVTTGGVTTNHAVNALTIPPVGSIDSNSFVEYTLSPGSGTTVTITPRARATAASYRYWLYAEWGDGTLRERITANNPASHTYPDAGPWELTVVCEPDTDFYNPTYMAAHPEIPPGVFAPITITGEHDLTVPWEGTIIEDMLYIPDWYHVVLATNPRTNTSWTPTEASAFVAGMRSVGATANKSARYLTFCAEVVYTPGDPATPVVTLHDMTVSGRTVTLRPVAADTGTAIVSFVINWGDGSAPEAVTSGTVYTHTYASGSEARYTITAWAQNALTESSTATRSVSFLTSAASASVSTRTAMASMTVAVDDAEGEDVQFLVANWGDGTSSLIRVVA